MLLNSEKSLAGHSVCALLLTAMSLVAGADFAAPFTNLDFEQATIPPGTPAGTVSAAAAFPGWTVRIGNVETSEAYFDYDGIGEPFVALYDQRAEGLGIPLLQGAHTSILGTGYSGFGSFVNVSLAQNGDIPTSIKSIRFLSEGHRSPPVVSLDGLEIPLQLLSTQIGIDRINTYGGDISAFAGISGVELRFSSPVPPSGTITGLDSITFSTVPVPEPGATIFAVVIVWYLLCLNPPPRA